MTVHALSRVVGASLVLMAIVQCAPAQDDVADVPSQDVRIGDDRHKRYFLIGPAAAEPESGFGLVVVLPGGAGDAEFHPFVKRIFKHALPEGYLVAQPVAVKWTPRQQIVWPTAGSRERGMQFTTEEFIDAAIDDVAARHKLDSQRIFTLSWSSSGPAAYAASLTSDRIRGSFIAMSVFKPNLLPKLDRARGQRYFLYHSPDDRVCPFRMAEQASRDLANHGAAVKLEQYSGGHGWQGPLYDSIRNGIDWLVEGPGGEP